MDIAQIAKEVRKQLKEEFPRCKFSVTISRFSMGQSLDVSLMSAPFAAVRSNSKIGQDGYAQLNQFRLRLEPHDYMCNGVLLTAQAWHVMKRADEIANQRNWDNSDRQVDYFDVNFYFHANIGKWDKPFVQMQ